MKDYSNLGRVSSSGPERLAVLVYIHGDSYEWNSGNPYDGSTLASYGQVIVITLNFRLGALGFLRPTLRDTVSNFGLLDQNAALHWIKENIVNFNGDPSKVTIFGHGTGAALANLLLISPITQLPGGIFQRAILMSGSALSKWALTWDPYKYTIQVAKALGCPLSDRGDELTRCLRSKTTVELRDVRLQTPPFTTPLGPIVDGVIIKKDPFVTMVENERVFGRYELLYGVTPAESYNVLTAAEVKFGMSLDRKNKLLRAYVSNNFNHQTSSIYSAILNQYDSYSTSKLPDERSTRDQTQEILSDAQIVAPVVNMGDLHSNLNQRSYFYVFNHQSAYGDYPVSQGTVHGEELAYVFGAPLVGGFSHFTLNYTQDEVLLSELVMKLWTNFAKTGNPNLPTPQDFLTKNASPNWVDNLRTMWPPYDRNQQLYLQLDLQIVKHSHYRARQLALWNRLIPDLVSSSGTRSDPISLFPGATPPTITLAPTVRTVMPEYPEMFVPDKATPRPVHHQSGPRIIKPVPTKPPPTPVYPVADKEEAAAKESTQQAEVPLAGTPIQLVVGIGVVIFCVNCMIMGLIVMYYRKHKHRHESDGIKDTDSTVSANPSETSSITLIDMKGNVESERASRKSSRSVDKNSLEGISENCSRTSTLSRDSSRKRKRSQSADSTDSHDHSESKPNRSSSSGHRRNKSDNSVYIDLGKESKSKVKNEISRSGKQPSVKFNDAPVLLDNNLNRSTSSIASKSSVKSTSSRASVRSGSSRASVKIGSTAKPVRRNTSNQSLPTADYGWTAPGEVPKSVNFSNSPDDEEAENAVKKSVPIMRKRSYPKITTVPPPIDEGSSTIPRPRPPPPPRSTSLTARDIEELEKLQVTYRSTIPPCHTSSDSCEHSGSEPFYSMGGGEAPARAPGLMYGPTMVPPPENPGLNVIKNDGSDYDQYQKFQAPYSMQNPRNSSESPLPLPPSQSYLTFGDNRGPRGPLASFGKWSDPMTSSANFDVIRLSPVSPIPPPVPAHQIPLTPSILQSQTPLSFPSPPILAEPPTKPLPSPTISSSSSTAMFDQTENTGTIKRQKPKTNNDTNTLEKPLKSALKTTSAYDKPQSKSSGSSLHVGIVSPSTRSGGPSSPQSVSSVSSPSPSISSVGSGSGNPIELKSILVKRTPKASQETGSSNSKYKTSDA
ncbi:Carboxylesterase type B [Trinorchestia longiramus]|nr:Carboxylesterase type B [Trinorchestia longiramus]